MDGFVKIYKHGAFGYRAHTAYVEGVFKEKFDYGYKAYLFLYSDASKKLMKKCLGLVCTIIRFYFLH